MKNKSAPFFCWFPVQTVITGCAVLGFPGEDAARLGDGVVVFVIIERAGIRCDINNVHRAQVVVLKQLGHLIISVDNGPDVIGTRYQIFRYRQIVTGTTVEFMRRKVVDVAFIQQGIRPGNNLIGRQVNANPERTTVAVAAVISCF